MACVECFFNNQYQDALKRKTFKSNRFEQKLLDYKSSYLNELQALKSVKDCHCKNQKKQDGYVRWTDAFLDNVRKNKNIIEETFDTLRKIYISYISESSKVALDDIWQFLNTNSLLEEEASSLLSSKFLFRARKKGHFNNDVAEFFHVPFDKRSSIGNQRFSISGQPMLYLSTSVMVAQKELGVSINNLYIAGFVQKEDVIRRLYKLSDPIYENVIQTLPIFFKTGSEIDYHCDYVVPNYKTIVSDIRRSIVTQILTFPTDKKGVFVEEYVLPQMLTTALFERKFNGIVFPSTKQYEVVSTKPEEGNIFFNIAFFVNFDPVKEQDQKLLDKFLYFPPDVSGSFWRRVCSLFSAKKNWRSRVKILQEKMRGTLRLSDSNGRKFRMPLGNAVVHIEKMSKIKVDGLDYFGTSEGRAELYFFENFVERIEEQFKKA